MNTPNKIQSLLYMRWGISKAGLGPESGDSDSWAQMKLRRMDVAPQCCLIPPGDTPKAQRPPQPVGRLSLARGALSCGRLLQPLILGSHVHSTQGPPLVAQTEVLACHC